MPLRQIVITETASFTLFQELRVYIPSGLYESDKGDVGAVLAREEYHIPRNKIRLAVSIALDCGCEARDIYSAALPPEDENSESYELATEPKPAEQLEFNLVVDGLPQLYLETAHLEPDGKRRRKKR